MILSKQQAQNVVESPTKKIELLNSLDYESRLRVFTTSLTENALTGETGWDYFITELRTALSVSKVAHIMDYATYPLSVVDISDNVLTEMAKVFDSKNAFFNISAKNDVRDAYLQSTIGDLGLFTWIRDVGLRVLLNEPNGIVV